MPNQNTYYSETELQRLKEIAEERDESFSGIVREAIHEYYGINND